MSTRASILDKIRGRSLVAPLSNVYPASVGDTKNLGSRGVCRRPFTSLQLVKDYDGSLYVTPCCISWLHDGDFKPKVSSAADIKEFWTGRFMEDLRKSVQDGSYRMCSQERCPYLASDSISKHMSMDIPDGKSAPSAIEYSAEISCNLACPSCRSGPRFDHPTDSNIPVQDLLALGISHFSSSGAGEFFMSRQLLDMARNFRKHQYPALKSIGIISNGTMFSESEWKQLSPDFKNLIRFLVVSIDAASKTVYSVVRKGARYDDLMKNLQFLCEKHHSGEIPEMSFSFTVSSDNVADVLSFLRFANDLGVHSIRLDNIQDWGHLGSGYASKAVHLEGHPSHNQYYDTIEAARVLATELGIDLIGSAVKR